MENSQNDCRESFFPLSFGLVSVFCVFSPKLKSHISKARSLDLIFLKPLCMDHRSSVQAAASWPQDAASH